MSIYNKHIITTVLKDGQVIQFNDTVNEFEYKVRLSPNIEYTKEGYLICRNAIVGNVGELLYSERELKWSNSNKAVRVMRKADDIFDEGSLASLEGKPVTILHPEFDVDSKNYREIGHGTVLTKGRRDGGNILVDVIFQSEELVDMVAPEVEDEFGNIVRKLNENFRDLSLGYKAKLVQIALDLYKQTDIIYNHLAVVASGRQVNATIVDGENKNIQKEENKKMSIFEKMFKKGKKVVRDEQGIHILDEEVEVLGDEDKEEIETKDEKEPKKEEKKDEKTKEVKDTDKDKVEDEENKDEKEPKKEEKKEIMKDMKYFQDALKEAMLLPDGAIKVATIDALNKDFNDAFPQQEKKEDAFKDAKAVDTDKIDKKFNDKEPQPKGLRFDEVARAKDRHYRNLTDPFAHKNWEAFNDNFANERSKGRSATQSLK